MRNALTILVVGGVLSVGGLEESRAADTATSVYAIPLEAHTIPRDDEPGLLPMRVSDRVQIPVIDRADIAPQASAVEAIPTPTAFHAGGALLGMILIRRLVRKVRWN